MNAHRRAVPTRHEFRCGTRGVAALGAAFLFLCALTFGVGVLVGREMAPSAGSRAKADTGSPSGPEAATAPPVTGAAASPGKVARGRTEERLTFYRTLTAPTPDLPAVGPPTIEERIVPREEVLSSPEPRPDGRGVPEKLAAPASATRPEPPARARATAAAAGTAEPPLWTVQVSSFRSRVLADELRARLVTRGFDAYLVSAATEEGRVRYRVRVGAFPTRAEAERAAAEIRSERTLSPFVTTRSR